MGAEYGADTYSDVDADTDLYTYPDSYSYSDHDADANADSDICANSDPHTVGSTDRDQSVCGLHKYAGYRRKRRNNKGQGQQSRHRG